MAAPTLPPMDMAVDSSFNPDFSHPASPVNDSPVDGASAPAVQPVDESKPHESSPRVQEILFSDLGVNILLNRLKASIASSRDFASFLKRRGNAEETHAENIKKILRQALDSGRKPDSRHESFQRQFEQVIQANERMAANGTQFDLTLHQMHENLVKLANQMEASRKQWKQQGLAAEKKVQDAEALASKAKIKYDGLAEDYDRVKTGDSGAGRKFGLKGPKSAAQHEEDLHRKVQAADADYASKVQTAQTNRRDLVATTRPEAVKALVELIREIDAALTMEMQKYAAFQEKLAVNDGQVISPQPLKGSSTSPSPSIGQLIFAIDNDKDFDDYVLKHASKVPTTHSDVKYEKHPSLAPTQSTPTPAASANQRPSPPQQPAAPSSFSSYPHNASSQQHLAQPEPHGAAHPSLASNYGSSYPSNPPSQYDSLGSSSHLPQPSHGDQSYPSGSGAQSMSKQSTGVSYGPTNPSQAPAPNHGGGAKPVFGVSLDDLFERDGSPVPMVVCQCIQAVDMYGLEVEGIYRIPGTSSHIQHMKTLFNTDASTVDFRNPEAFQHDVNSVAGLLKQFFRELPDPLLTRQFYQGFIDAAKIPDSSQSRDSMHALINALPDSNYATLRAVVLHLHRVKQMSESNRMSSTNLAICWAPNLMGAHTSSNIADAGLQGKVVQTVLDSVLQIFDED